jgi:hypothetical protein
MLMHHDEHRSYEEAASTAAVSARHKLQTVIETGRRRAGAVIERVMHEQLQDRLVRGEAMTFEPNSTGLVLRVGDDQQHLHRHALTQVASRVGLPGSYVQYLQAPEHQPWGAHLAATNLNTLIAETVGDQRFLLRSVGNEVRGFLSDRYRRLDSRLIVDSFARACGEAGALPFEGYATDTRIAIKAILPQILEPIRFELMSVGVVLETSDFGQSALAVRIFALRLACTNCLITDTSIRQVHLGGRLADDIAWSDETQTLDTRRMASAVRDVVRGQLAPASIEKLQDSIRQANDEKIEPKHALLELRRTLTKAEAEAAVAKFNSPDVELLPPGNTSWRLSNAVSWLAGQTEDTERKLDLMKAAGTLLSKAA